MDLLWMILLVFLVCAEAQNVTEVKVELGQNVTLNCSGDNVDVYWYVEFVSQVRGHISRTFSGDPADTEYFVSSVISKYSAWENSLLITNITAEDCRLYFCGRRINGDIQFVDTFSLVSDVPVGPPNNSSMENDDNQHIHLLIRQYKFTMYGSFVLNFLLVTERHQNQTCSTDPAESLHRIRVSGLSPGSSYLHVSVLGPELSLLCMLVDAVTGTSGRRRRDKGSEKKHNTVLCRIM
ncbi:uncharacterized protein [Channa argus]|uniref:uncharacterized protein isoform X2 n=1 Tax=Channa argus TaxID=215402 RepID=UPI00352259D1